MGKDREKVGLKTLVQGFVYEHAILARADRITKASHLTWPEGFDQSFIDSISDNYIPILYSNHQSWYDGLPVALIATKLMELSRQTQYNIDGFLLPIAASLEEGNQGQVLQRMYQITFEYLKRRSVEMIPVVREKDRVVHGIDRSNIAFLKQLMKGVKSGKGIATFPEGSVQGGRKNGDGSVKGMQFFTENVLETMDSLLKKLGKKALFIPAGISRSYDVLDPDTKKPTVEALVALYHLRSPNIVSINIGDPIKTDDIQGFTTEELNRYFGKKVASLLPFEERGVFKEPITIYQS